MESGRLSVVDDGVDFLELFLHAGLKSRHIVLGLDLVERYHLERCLVFGKERIFIGFCLLLAAVAGSQYDDA